MKYLTERLYADWAALLELTPRLMYAAALILLFALLARVAGRLSRRLLQDPHGSRAGTPLLQSLVVFGVASVGLLMALGVLGLSGIATSMLATGGVMAIIVGFAFREIGENLLAGFFLSFSRPFERGDLIRTGALTGTVRGIALRHVHIRTADACDVFVPSAQIFREPLFNYTRDGLRRPDFRIGVAYHDEPEAVIELLEQALRQVPGVLADPGPNVSIREFGSAFIEYEAWLWVDLDHAPQDLLAVVNAAKISCWRALRAAGMTFSTDVRTGIDIASVPPLSVSGS